MPGPAPPAGRTRWRRNPGYRRRRCRSRRCRPPPRRCAGCCPHTPHRPATGRLPAALLPDEPWDDLIDRLDHQMDIDGGIDPVAPQRPAHGGTEGEVRDIVVVHDIEVYPVGARARPPPPPRRGAPIGRKDGSGDGIAARHGSRGARLGTSRHFTGSAEALQPLGHPASQPGPLGGRVVGNGQRPSAGGREKKGEARCLPLEVQAKTIGVFRQGRAFP